MIDYKISRGTAGNSDIPERYDDLPSHNIEVFQSENVQNILDARSKNKDFVEIHYEIKKLSKQERDNIKALLEKDFFKMLTRSFEQCKSQDIEEQAEKVKLALKNEEKWFSLTITERNTTGLTGDESGKEPGSKYHALMRHTNMSEKDEISGGTFGKGSSVYTYSSGLWIWFAYSMLEKPSNNTTHRFIGRGMIAPFTDNGKNMSYNGPLWYSRPESKEEDYINGFPQQGLPYKNEAAHIQALKFGLSKRTEPGTTYLIPVFWPDGLNEKEISEERIASDLKLEIIKRWFVPIYNEELRCFIKITGEEDSEVSITKNHLKTIPELNYKLEILEWYQNRSKEDKRFKIKQVKLDLPYLKKAHQKKLEEKHGLKFGKKKTTVFLDLVVRQLYDDEMEHRGFLDSDGIGTVNRIALIRNKGMLVNHYPYISRNKADLKSIAGDNTFEGILFAGKTCREVQPKEAITLLEIFLSYSENPAHNEWIHNINDLNRCHLKRFEDSPSPSARVNYMFTKIDHAIQEFFPKDDEQPTKKEICSFWRKLYRLPSTGDVKIRESTFNYETLDKGFDLEGRYYWKLRFVSKGKPVKLVFKHYLNSLEGPINDEREYENLGIPEFSELKIVENGQEVHDVTLNFDTATGSGVPKEITVKTCRITKNKVFKNLDPVLEISDQ